MSFLLPGSKRISDSEVSDYDCDDGIGVVSGTNVLIYLSMLSRNISFLFIIYYEFYNVFLERNKWNLSFSKYVFLSMFF